MNQSRIDYQYAKRRSSTITAVQKHRDSVISYQDIAKFRETAKILSKSAKIYQRQRYEKRLKYDNRFTLSNGTPNFFYETSCRIVILLQDVEVFREKCRKADLQPKTKDFRKAHYSILEISHTCCKSEKKVQWSGPRRCQISEEQFFF